MPKIYMISRGPFKHFVRRQTIKLSVFIDCHIQHVQLQKLTHTFLEWSWVHVCLLNTSRDSARLCPRALLLGFRRNSTGTSSIVAMTSYLSMFEKEFKLEHQRQRLLEHSVNLLASDSLEMCCWRLYKRHQSAIYHSFSWKIKIEMMQVDSLCKVMFFLKENLIL